MAERVKYLHAQQKEVTMYFWRTTQQQEIDLIEEQGEALRAYEFKWNEKQKVRFSQTFTENYLGSETFVVSPETIETFVGIKYD